MDLLGSGREADVYALDAGRVLRRYRRGDDATAEAELMNHLSGAGFPVPRVHDVSGPDMILERLDGSTMTETFTAGQIGIAEGAAVLADLHRRLHDLPPRSGRVPGDRILHRDLHPENVMLTSRGPVVIDWHSAAEGPPAVDVCLTAIIMAQVAADPADPRAAAAGDVLSAFLRRVVAVPGQTPGLAVHDLVAAVDEAMEIRRADPALTPEESAGLAATVLPLISAGLPGIRPAIR